MTTQADPGTPDTPVAQTRFALILHLREDASEYLSAWKLKDIIGKYSDHIALPILMRKEEWDAEAQKQVGSQAQVFAADLSKAEDRKKLAAAKQSDAEAGQSQPSPPNSDGTPYRYSER